MTEPAELVVKGLALGSVYGLVALGFVVVFKATGVINFAQGSLLLMGAYLTSSAAVGWGVPFPLAVVAAALGAIAFALTVERVVVRRLYGRPPVAAVMATLGGAIAADQLVTLVWGFGPRHVGDPWGAGSVRVAGMVLSSVEVVALVTATATVAGLTTFFRGSRLGLALRAAASDPEAAAALGIRPATVSRTAWALAAVVGAVAGMLLASGPGAAVPNLGEQALRAFPAVVLGGFVSLGGALAGGLVIGVVEVVTARYAPGQELVVPYVLMLAVALARPEGLFATREARRL